MFMEKEILEKLIEKKLSTRAMAEILKCSQTNVNYWLRKYGLNTLFISTDKVCIICESSLKGKQTSFCSKKCKGESYTSKANNYICQKERSIKRKMFLINEKGGKCEICGYNRNYAALCFHHKDSSDKVFTLDSRKISNTNLNSLIKEAEKCKLLCHNCHMEIHYPSLNLVGMEGFEPPLKEL